MGRPYESITALVGCAVGPLRSHLGSFIASLIDQQYAARGISQGRLPFTSKDMGRNDSGIQAMTHWPDGSQPTPTPCPRFRVPVPAYFKARPLACRI